MAYNRMMKLRRIEQAILDMDRHLDVRDRAFRVALILACSVRIGPNVRRIAHYTGYPYQFVEEVGRRLRQSKIWNGRFIDATNWCKEDGALAFWCEVNVGLGQLKRTKR
jgi:hypothetical protein